MAFLIGDEVRYGALGQCKILDIARKKLCGVEKEYFVLSRNEDNSTIYIPVEKENALKPVLPPLNAQDVQKLIDTPTMKIDWNEDDVSRQKFFEVIWEREDTFEVCALLKAIAERISFLKSTKKKPKQALFNALKICEKICFMALSRTLEIEIDGVLETVQGNKEIVFK